MTGSGPELAVRAAFRQQAQACESLGSPLMARLMAGLADRLLPGNPVADRVLGWTGDPSAGADSVPLRLAGGLHALVLSGVDPDLARAYANPAAAPATAALAALPRHADVLLDWLASAPQTNEVRRSAVLIAAAQWLTARFGLPIVLSELGASAGLNLLWDHYALSVRGRAGAEATDTAPLARLEMEGDGRTPGAALTLTLWPGGQVTPHGRADFHGRWVNWAAPDPGLRPRPRTDHPGS